MSQAKALLEQMRKVTLNVLVWIMVLGFVLGSSALPAQAKTADSVPSTGGLQVNVVDSDSGTVYQAANFGLNMLQSRPQHEQRYSSIDSMPAPVGTLASGVYLSEVLQASGISQDDVNKIRLYATDSWSKNYEADYLWGSADDRRYFYPNLIPCWDSENQQPGSGAEADDGAVEVEPMFALVSYQDRYLDLKNQAVADTVRERMDGLSTLRFCFGQKAADIQGSGVITTNAYGKWVYRMDVTLKAGVTPPPANPAPLPSPVLSASYTEDGIEKVTLGQSEPVRITFADDAGWRAAISSIDVGNTTLGCEQFEVEAGLITIDPGVFTEPGVYSAVVHATGYTDDCATELVTGPLAKPQAALSEGVLSWSIVEHAAGYLISVIPGSGPMVTHYVTGTTLDLYSLGLPVGSYFVTVAAQPAAGSECYTGSAASNTVIFTAQFQLPAAPELIADSSGNLDGQSITLTFSEDTAWRSAIHAVTVDGQAAESDQYDKSVSGQLTLDGSLFPQAGDYEIVVLSAGYRETTVTQHVFTSVLAPAALNLSGSPELIYNAEPLYYNLSELVLVATDQYGEDFSLTGQEVTWAIAAGQTTAPAEILGGMLTVNGTGTVTVTAAVGSIISNPLALTVSSPSGDPGTDYPEEIILTWSEDPQTTQTVSWRINADSAGDQAVQYLPFSQGEYSGDFSGAPAVTAAKSELYGDYDHAEAILEGLAPATRYAYRVGRAGAWSHVSYFTTAGAADQFSFVYMGDVQEGYDAWGTMLQQVYAQNPQLKFGLLGGDLINTANSTTQWEQFMNNASPVFDEIPLMPTAGNHDEPQAGNLEDYPYYWRYFALPENGPPGYAEQFYSFDYVNCHIAVLDSNIMGTTTPAGADYRKISTWIENDLNGSSKEWKFLVFHHPAYPVVSDAYSAKIRQYWAPLFEQCGVDMAFVGHQHVYMRTKPLAVGQVQSDPSQGTIYVMGNAGSKFYPAGTDEEFQYYIAKQIDYQSNYALIDINGATLTITVKNDQGDVIDQYAREKTEPAYIVTPEDNEEVYRFEENPGDNIPAMTVKDGFSGFAYFKVEIEPVVAHEGTEAVIFVHTRNGTQLSINATKADFDQVGEAAAGFNVESGDVVKVYIADDLTNGQNLGA